MSRRGAAWLALALWGWSAGARGATGRGGQAAASDLAFPATASAAASSGLSAGWVADASAVEANPARLGLAGSAGAEGSQAFWPGGFTDTHVAASYRLEGTGTAAAMVRVIRTEIPLAAEAPDGSFGGEGGSYLYQTAVATAGFAPELDELGLLVGMPVRAGLAASLLERTVNGTGRSGGSATAGLEADVWPDLTVRATVRGVGSLAGEALPGTGALGAAWRTADAIAVGDRFTASAEASLARDEGFGGGVAAEYAVAWDELEVAVRVGYRAAEGSFISPWPTGGLAFRVASLRIEFGAGSIGSLGAAEVLSLSWIQHPAAELPTYGETIQPAR